MQVQNCQFFDTDWSRIRLEDCILEDFISVFGKIIDRVYMPGRTILIHGFSQYRPPALQGGSTSIENTLLSTLSRNTFGATSSCRMDAFDSIMITSL